MSVIDVDTDPDPVTLIVYVPAGVPFGLGVPPPPPPLLPLEPQPIAKNSNTRASVPSGTNPQTRRLRTAKRVKSEIPRRVRVPGHRSLGRRFFVIDGGTTAVREVVVITKEAFEPAATFTAPQAAPVGNPEHVRVYGTLPMSVIVKVADEPALTVCEGGVAVREDRFPYETFRTVLPPSRSAPVSGGPNGATMM